MLKKWVPSASTNHPLSFETAPKSKFASLQFHAKLKARGRPKRAERQLCFFNKTSADRKAPAIIRKGKKRSAKGEETDRQTIAKNNADVRCPVCTLQLCSNDADFMSTDCCQLVVHKSCFLEFDQCPAV